MNDGATTEAPTTTTATAAAVYRRAIADLQNAAPTYGNRSQHTTTFIKNKVSKCMSLETVKKRLPFLSWIRGYNCSTLSMDFVAGFTVGLMMIPQSLAYGVIAGLPPNYGLYSAWVGCFVYCFLGTCVELSVGPTAIMALLTLQYTNQGGATYAILLTFISGVVEIISAFINLGFLINFISKPVISGFTSAAAVTIASSQLKALFGLKLKTKGTLDTWIKVVSNIKDFRWQDLVLGISGIILLNFIQSLPNRSLPCKSDGGKHEGVVKKLVFFLSLGRNALLVILSSIIAYCLDGKNQPFTLTGHVEAGIPTAALPAFSLTDGNQTIHFTDIMTDVGLGVVMIPFIAMLYIVAIASAFSKGQTVDATQEILALGVSNIVGSFFGSMPVTAAMSRTAVNSTSGVKTPLGGLVTGAMVLLALMFLTPYFRYIPKASLGAIIMCAVLKTIDHEIVLKLWKSSRMELATLVITFISCILLGLDLGIIIGICANLGILLFSVATPTINNATVTPSECTSGYVVVTVKHGLQYPNTAHVRTAISKAGLREANGVSPVVVDCSNIHTLDFTAAKGIQSLSKEFNKRGQLLVLIGLSHCITFSLGDLLDGVHLCENEESLQDILNDKHENMKSPTASIGLDSKLIDTSRIFTNANNQSDKEYALLAPMVQIESI